MPDGFGIAGVGLAEHDHVGGAPVGDEPIDGRRGRVLLLDDLLGRDLRVARDVGEHVQRRHLAVALLLGVADHELARLGRDLDARELRPAGRLHVWTNVEAREVRPEGRADLRRQPEPDARGARVVDMDQNVFEAHGSARSQSIAGAYAPLVR